MQFHISEIDRVHEVHLHENLSMPRIAHECGQIDSIETVDATVSVIEQDGIYHALGDLETTVNYLCARCIISFTAPLSAKLDESFTQIAEKEEQGAHLVARDIVDLNPYIEQELFLAVDYRPLCSPNCKGLCPECGCNRNEKTCSCDTLTIDPRLSVLKDLLLEGKSE